MRPRTRTTGAVLAGAALLALAAGYAAKGDVRYDTETTMKLGGTLGAVARFMGAGKPVTGATYLHGNVLRTDNGDHSSIIDLDRGAFTEIDHKKKEYTTLTFDEWRQRLEQAMAQAREQAEAAKGQPAPAESTQPSESEPNNVKLTFNASAEQTGNTQTIDGHPCKETKIVLVLEAQDTVTGETDTLTTTSNVWLAPDVAAYQEVQDFYRRLGEKLGEEWRASSINLLSLLTSSNPEAAESFQKLQEQAGKLQGAPLLTVTRIEASGTKPATEAKAEEEPESKGGLFGKKPSLGGLLKKKVEKKEEGNGRSLILEITTKLSNLSTAALSDDLFQVPEGYKPVSGVSSQ